MKHFPLLLIILLCVCAGPPKYFPPEIPVKYGKVYVEPFRNMSTIELARGFPRDTDKVDIIFQEVEKTYRDLVSEISLYGKRGGYEMVEADEFPTIVVSPVLMPYKLDGNQLTLPVFVKVLNKETNEQFKKQFDFTITYPGKNLNPENTYHFWGIMLAEWRRNFPKDKIAGMFYGKRENEVKKAPSE